MREYWEGLAGMGVPYATGVQNDSESWDLDVHEKHGWGWDGRLLDIGCGTGRVAARAADYTGVDISRPMVDFCRAKGLRADAIEGPDDLPAGPFDRVTMLSVMTHMGREDRRAYLRAIRARLTGEAIIDILPGVEMDGIARAQADDPTFRADLAEAGFSIIEWHEIRSRDNNLHRYFRVR